MDKKDKTFRVIRLEAENVKRLRAVAFDPDQNAVIIGGANAQGKQQPISEPILTPLGWSTIGAIRVGDRVIGSSGKPTRVKAIHPQTEKRTFRLTVADGGQTRCGPDHLWTVFSWKCGHHGNDWGSSTFTTQQLIDSGLKTKAGGRLWALPNLDAVQFDDSGMNLPIDPYALGVIIGVGHIEQRGYVTISTDLEILDRLFVRSSWRTVRNNCAVLASAEWSRPLEHLGLAGKNSYEKFIPDIYQTASEEDRRALLAGLVDTDGTSPAKWAEYSTSSERLARDVIQLARGLGYNVNVTSQVKKYNYNGEHKEGRLSYCVRIKRSPCPFTLARKLEKWNPLKLSRPSNSRDAFRFIDKIEQVEDEESVCIEVEAEDGLYVTNDFLVTHNSSLIDSLFYALAGGRSLPARPIRDGEEKATIRVELNGLTVERVIKEGGSTLVVRNADGDALQSPQKILDRMVGALSFDPLDFVRADMKGQVKQLEGVLGINVAERDAERKRVFDKRTEINREVARLKSLVGPEPVVPTDVQNTEALLIELKAFNDAASAVKLADAKVDAAVKDLEMARNHLTRLESEIAQLQERLFSTKQNLASMETTVEKSQKIAANARVKTKGRRTAAEIQQDIQAYQGVERLRLAHEQWVLNKRELLHAEEESFNRTTQLTGMDDARTAEVTAAVAKVGLAGLGLDENGVTWNGVPLLQCSSAEQLRVAVGLGFAANPQIRVVLLREGALLDDRSLAMVVDMAKQADAQVWIEVVGDRGPGSVIIEDGAIQAPAVVDAKWRDGLTMGSDRVVPAHPGARKGKKA